MSTPCETYQAAIMAHLDGGLGKGEVAALEAHMARCAFCREHHAALAALTEGLVAIGAATAPKNEVDIVDSVMTGVQEIREGTRLIDEASLPEHPLVMPYVDHALDEVTRARFERTLRTHPDLRREVDEMRRLDSALRVLADECRAVPPNLSVEQAVMDAVACARELAEDPQTHRVEEALWGLGETIRDHTQAVDIEDEVWATVAAREDMELEETLTALGRDLAQGTPRVDMVDEVMHVVKTSRRARQVTARPATWRASTRTFSYWLRGLGLTAAATVAILAGLLAARWTDQPVEQPRVARGGTHLPAGNGPPHAGNATEPGKGNGNELVLPDWPPISALPQAILKRPEPDAEKKATEKTAQERKVTLAEAIEQHRLGQANDKDALARLAEWAQLTPQEARDLLEEGGLTVEQMVGATQYLPPDEAVQVLEGLVADHPEDPYLQLSLARAMGDNGASLEEQLAQVALWGALDTNNGLPSYAEAALYYETGDYDAALQALAQGNTYEEAQNYSLESANARADVLEAAGLDRETAKYLSALLGGADEYADISSMTAKLAELGAYYESVGDFDSATQVYQALLRLGEQVGNSAALPSDTLASADTIMLATQALQELLSDPDTLALLSQTVNQLFQLLGNFTTALGEYNALLSGDPEAVSSFVESILMGAWDQMIGQAFP